MTTKKQLAAWCDKCKSVVYVEEGETVRTLINLESITTFFTTDRPKLKTEIRLCPKCSGKFVEWLGNQEG